MARFDDFMKSFNQVIYVDGTSGNDTSGNGAETLPYKTISKAVASVTRDNTFIYIMTEGTYTETRLTSILNANFAITIGTIAVKDKTKRVILNLASTTSGTFIMNKINTIIGVILQRSPGGDTRVFEYFFDPSTINLSFRNCVFDNKPYAPTDTIMFAGNSAGAKVVKLEYINCSIVPNFTQAARGSFISCALAKNFTNNSSNLQTSFDNNFYTLTETAVHGVYNGEFAWGNYFYNKLLISSNGKCFAVIPKKVSDETVVPKMTNNAAPSGLAFSRGALGINQAYLAFNQTDENEGYCSTSSSGGVGFLGYKFTSPKIISKYAVRNGTLNSYYKRLPRDWTFEGSNDSTNGFDGKWEILDRQSKQIWSTPTTDKVFEIDNIKAYTAYRINWTANNGATDYTSVGELKMFELLNVPSLIEIPDSNESSFQKYGMNFDNPLNLSAKLNICIDIQSSNTTLGVGKIFEHYVDLSKTRVNKITFS